MDYLQLRLASLSPQEAFRAAGACLDPGAVSDFERGVKMVGGSRREFIAQGSDAATYNRLMTALRERTEVIEPGRLLPPALPRGVDPYKPISRWYLSFEELVVIAEMLRDNASSHHIGWILGHSASFIQREVARNHSADGPYRAETVRLKAYVRRLCPELAKLVSNHRLQTYVIDGLRAQWSSEQFSHRLLIDYSDEKDMSIRHETIYGAF
ncbi:MULTISPECIES: hypothetical protein [Corynebacterium]|uniref:hypothetical protein n=1 Tax=Corynebacterium TaxID=1716 RepID=UPI001CE3FB79|nr:MULTISPECIES: hypothetical protein [Corynebacterium]